MTIQSTQMAGSSRDTMPKGQGDLTIEGHGIEPIPETGRYGVPSRTFTVWFTSNMVPAAFAIGLLAPILGLGWWTGLLAILLGNLVGCILPALLSALGPSTGMAQMPMARLPFGKSIVLPGILLWIVTVAWDAINAFFGAYAIMILTNNVVPFPVGVFLIILCQAVLSIVGYEAVHLFARYASIALAILFAVVTLDVAPHMNFALADVGGFSIGMFVLMTTAIASFNLGWSLYASDYSRYLPVNSSKPHIAIWTYVGLFISAAWLEILGLAVFGALGSEADASHQIYSLVGGGFIGALAMIAIVVGTVAVNAINDYTGSLSVLAAGLRIWRPASALVVGVVSFGAALWLYYGDFYSSFENWLLLVTYWVGPWLGIVVVDWLMRKGKFHEATVVSFSLLPSGRNAFIALVVGFIVSIPFMNQTLFEGPGAIALNGADITYYVGFVVAAVIYWVAETSIGRTSVAEA